jgi:hypothetical protein
MLGVSPGYDLDKRLRSMLHDPGTARRRALPTMMSLHTIPGGAFTISAEESTDEAAGWSWGGASFKLFSNPSELLKFEELVDSFAAAPMHGGVLGHAAGLARVTATKVSAMQSVRLPPAEGEGYFDVGDVVMVQGTYSRGLLQVSRIEAALQGACAICEPVWLRRLRGAVWETEAPAVYISASQPITSSTPFALTSVDLISTERVTIVGLWRDRRERSLICFPQVYRPLAHSAIGTAAAAALPFSGGAEILREIGGGDSAEPTGSRPPMHAPEQQAQLLAVQPFGHEQQQQQRHEQQQQLPDYQLPAYLQDASRGPSGATAGALQQGSEDERVQQLVAQVSLLVSKVNSLEAELADKKRILDQGDDQPHTSRVRMRVGAVDAGSPPGLAVAASTPSAAREAQTDVCVQGEPTDQYLLHGGYTGGFSFPLPDVSARAAPMRFSRARRVATP